MRYVDIERLRLDDGWLADAIEATRDLLANKGTAHANGELWRDLKARLAELLYNKCWFCETPVVRSDNAIDHFRPKSRVGDAHRKHDGYRWLAFERGNFRYACTLCNSRRVDVDHGTAGGKSDRFPLVDESARVYEVDPNAIDYDDLLSTVECEQPAILDPCHPSDWKLLGCVRENGRPYPATTDTEAALRVRVSIEVYHLDHEPTCKQRHLTATTFLNAVREAKSSFATVDAASPETRAKFEQHVRGILRMIDRTAPYSGEMIFLLRGQRSSDHPWIQELLET